MIHGDERPEPQDRLSGPKPNGRACCNATERRDRGGSSISLIKKARLMPGPGSEGLPVNQAASLKLK